MAQTVFANGRGIAHKNSSTMNFVFPDVCKTPTTGGPVPIPYPNIAQSSDAANGPTSVTIDGAMPMVQGAIYSKTAGDEAGSAGGVVSGMNRAEAEFMTYSFDVKIEGKGAGRLGDMLLHNKKNAFG